MRLELVTEVEDLGALREAWRDLETRLAHPYLYTTYNWIHVWLTQFRQTHQPYIVLVWDGPQLCGAAPLSLTRATLSGVPVRLLESIGSSTVGDTSDFLVAPGEVGPLAELFGFLEQHRREWHVLRLHGLLTDSNVLQAATKGAIPVMLRHETRPALPSWYLSIAGRWPEYLSTRSSNLRKTLPAKSRRLAREGGYEAVSYREPNQLETALKEVRAVYEKSWQQERNAGIFSPRQRGFYQEFARVAARHGELEIWVLKLGGKPIAFKYAVIHAGVAYWLKTEYDSEYSRYSPGGVLSRECMAAHFAAGLHGCDLMARYGDSKAEWTNGFRATHELLGFSPSPYGRVAQLVNRLRYRLIPHDESADDA